MICSWSDVNQVLISRGNSPILVLRSRSQGSQRTQRCLEDWKLRNLRVFEVTPPPSISQNSRKRSRSPISIPRDRSITTATPTRSDCRWVVHSPFPARATGRKDLADNVLLGLVLDFRLSRSKPVGHPDIGESDVARWARVLDEASGKKAGQIDRDGRVQIERP